MTTTSNNVLRAQSDFQIYFCRFSTAFIILFIRLFGWYTKISDLAFNVLTSLSLRQYTKASEGSRQIFFKLIGQTHRQGLGVGVERVQMRSPMAHGRKGPPGKNT